MRAMGQVTLIMPETRAQQQGCCSAAALRWSGVFPAAQAGTGQVAQRGGGRAAQRRLPRAQRGQQQRQVRGRGRGVRREERQLLRVQHALQLGRRAVARVRAGGLPAAAGTRSQAMRTYLRAVWC